MHQLTPGAQRAYEKMKRGEWHTPRELGTNRQIMNQLQEKRLVKMKNTTGNFCHAPENGRIYQRL